MKRLYLIAALAVSFFASVLMPSAASAQTANFPLGSELRGATVQVGFADGVTNTVNFNPDGTATIIGRNGETVNANWFLDGQQLCLQTGTGRECWPYSTALQTGQSVTLTSSCATTSRWTALSTQQPPPQPGRSGERG